MGVGEALCPAGLKTRWADETLRRPGGVIVMTGTVSGLQRLAQAMPEGVGLASVLKFANNLFIGLTNRDTCYRL